ncbi:DUF6283 family protein (plasmid) [Streptomyces sp. NBC_01298]|uniref:DUF6283 family protein n=1 Tax=Streptomyces sp. NBC_01298 TaxID=2903817 RepID=UPI002E0FFDA4|nr:DUF6283 family protein [Streptomyces sp. NBC_01298]
MTTLPPAPRPCTFCPYKTEVPSGVWSEEDYAKLPLYDGPTWTQPPGLFQCHVHDRDDDSARVCGGWAGCHDMAESLSLRLAHAFGEISLETAQTILDYVSPVPLFASGAEAAAHGIREILNPGPDARHAIGKLRRTRSDLT